MQRCPKSSLDICLIGMYPFVGCRYVSASEGSVVLFTKTSHEALQRSKRYICNFTSESSQTVTHIDTHTQTDRQTDYRIPRYTCRQTDL